MSDATKLRWNECARVLGGPFDGHFVAISRPAFNPAGFMLHIVGPEKAMDSYCETEDQLEDLWDEIGPHAEWTGKFRAADGSVTERGSDA